MNIYSQKVQPYVYRVTNIKTNEFYIGYREANTVPPTKDLMVKYFTSGSMRKDIIENPTNFKAEFLYVDESPIKTYNFEQILIAENIENPLCLNRMFYKASMEKLIYSKKGLSGKKLERFNVLSNKKNKSHLETKELIRLRDIQVRYERKLPLPTPPIHNLDEVCRKHREKRKEILRKLGLL